MGAASLTLPGKLRSSVLGTVSLKSAGPWQSSLRRLLSRTLRNFTPFQQKNSQDAYSRWLQRISGAVAAFISLRVDRRPPKPRLSWRASFIWNAGRRIASKFFRAARVITGALWGPCPSAGTSLAVRLTNCFLRNGDTLRRAFAITARSKELFRNAKSRAPAILMFSCASTRLAKLRPSSLSRSAAPRSARSCLLMDTLRALQRYAAKTASGYAPLGGVLVSARVVEAFERGSGAFMHGFTYQAHPVSTAAGNAVLDYLEAHKLFERANAAGENLRGALSPLHAHSNVGDVRGMGLLLSIEFVKDKAPREPFPKEKNIAAKIQQACLDEGVLTYPTQGCVDGLRGDHILLAPPFTISLEECALIARALQAAVAKVFSA